MVAQALIVVAALIALALWWRHRARRRPTRVAHLAERGRRADNYHCVELRYRGNACNSAKWIGAKRFLPDEAPAFPLPGCDAVKCSCRYVHHDDRRHSDRRNPFGQRRSEPPASVGYERRARTDRRKPPKLPFRPSIGR